MKEVKEMPFGKRFRVGNFEYLKITRVLGKKELNELRNQIGIPQSVRKHLQRGGLPYILVQTISGIWSISFACGSAMYNFIEYQNGNGETGEKALYNLFIMMYSDTAILGDNEYWNDKKKALDAFMKRCNEKKVSKEEDDKELDALRSEEEARANIVDMANNLKED